MRMGMCGVGRRLVDAARRRGCRDRRGVGVCERRRPVRLTRKGKLPRRGASRPLAAPVHVVEARVAARDGVPPRYDPIRRRTVRRARRPPAVGARPSGAAGVPVEDAAATAAAAADLLREGRRRRCIPRLDAASTVGAVLTEHLDDAHVIGAHDDVAVPVRRTRDVQRRCFGRRRVLGSGLGGGGLRGRVRVAQTLGRVGGRPGRRCSGLGPAHERDRRRVAEVVDRVAGPAQHLPRRDGRQNRRRHDGRVGREHLDRLPVLLVPFRRPRRPDVDLAVLAAADDVAGLVAERRPDLAARVLVAAELHLERLVAEVVHPDPRVVAGHEQLHLGLGVVRRQAGRPDAGDLAALGVLAPSRPDVDLGGVAEALGLVEETVPVQATGDGRLAVRREGDGGDEIRQLVPVRHALVRDAPQPQLRIQRAGQEEAVVARMEGDGRDKVAVLEAAEAFLATGMPQPHRLVHRRRQQEVVLRGEEEGEGSVQSGWGEQQYRQPLRQARPTHLAPAKIQHVQGVTFVLAYRLRPEDGRVQSHGLAGRVDGRVGFFGLVRLALLGRRDDDPHAHHAILPAGGQEAAVDAEVQRPDGAGSDLGGGGMGAIGPGKGRSCASGVGLPAAQLLRQKDAVEVSDPLVVRANLDVSGRGGMVRRVGVRGDGMREDGCIHSLGPSFTQLGLVVASRVVCRLFLLSTDDAAQKRDSTPPGTTQLPVSLTSCEPSPGGPEVAHFFSLLPVFVAAAAAAAAATVLSEGSHPGFATSLDEAPYLLPPSRLVASFAPRRSRCPVALSVWLRFKICYHTHQPNQRDGRRPIESPFYLRQRVYRGRFRPVRAAFLVRRRRAVQPGNDGGMRPDIRSGSVLVSSSDGFVSCRDKAPSSALACSSSVADGLPGARHTGVRGISFPVGPRPGLGRRRTGRHDTIAL